MVAILNARDKIGKISYFCPISVGGGVISQSPYLSKRVIWLLVIVPKMSRLIIKGLPTRYDDKQLHDLFSFAGEVTDARVIKTREGKSRQFGFVGFRTSKEAKNAQHRLDKSYVDTTKVSVEFAYSIGADAIPRPWSKYSKGSSEYGKRHCSREEEERRAFLREEEKRVKKIIEMKKKEKENEVKTKDKVAFQEFEETAGKRSFKPVWADGGLRAEEKSTLVASRKPGSEGKMLERKHVTFKADDSDDDDDELYDKLPDAVTARKVGSDDHVEDEEEAGDEIALNEHVSDLDYFKSKIVQSSDGEKDASEIEGKSAEWRWDDSQNDVADVQFKASDEDEGEAACIRGQVEESEQAGKEEREGNMQRKIEVSPDQDSDGNDDVIHEAKGNDSEHTKGDHLSKRKAEVANINPGETGRLLVRNVAYSVTEEELESIFEPFGSLSEVHIVRDSSTGKSKGMAFVQYLIPEHAPKALIGVDGTVQSGRILHVLPAKPRPSPASDKSSGKKKHRDPGDTEFKVERVEARKDAARKGLDNIAQHALHLSPDAIAQVIADRNSVTKAELYGTARAESGIAAVRLAMGEAMLQSETRQFLLEHGIDLEAATKVNLQNSASTAAAKRKRLSRTAFLIKNLSARSTENQLDEVFSRFGELRKLILVPSGLLAVVEYADSSDAKRAYGSLAYTKFGDTPLYLEWLPREALGEGKHSAHENPSARPNSSENDANALDKDLDAPVTEGKESLRNASVYVKNLNFDTRDEALREHFVKVLRKYSKLAASLRSANVAMKRSGDGRESKSLSMGFGFLEFSSPEDAVEVVKVAQNTVLNGHTLQLRLSKQTGDDKPLQKRKRPGSTKKAGPKLIVRNVAFQATKQDIKGLFSSFGQLKKVRIPRRMDGTHRGFAFVEFASKNEAKSAFEALFSAHLYGRHLVIEYADEDENSHMSVGQLQAKMATHMAKKRIRMIDGSAAGVDNGNDKSADEQAMIEDEMYG